MAGAVKAAQDMIAENIFNMQLAGTVHPGQQALIDKAGRLNRWRATGYLDPPQALAFVGEIEGDARFADGHKIVTSNVVWVDHRLRWIRTHNSFYRLGKPLSHADEDDGDGPGN